MYELSIASLACERIWGKPIEGLKNTFRQQGLKHEEIDKTDLLNIGDEEFPEDS
ncbi:MAG: hypothetical protein N3F08_00595 [Crenarchaeota archaeon]|nr:hypothetical protein [Thermoproteota archaeon]